MNIDSESTDLITKRSLTILVAGLLIGGSAAYVGLNYDNVDKQAVSQDLVSTLETSSGMDLEVVSVEESNGLYEVRIQDQENQLSTYYVTRDGEMIMQENGVTDFQQFQEQVSLQSQFTGCLEDQEVLMFGNQSQQATLAQVQLLGGSNMVSGIYADVNNEQTMQQATQVGVQRVPSFYYNGSVAQGVQTLDQLEDFTGCQYNSTE